MGFDGSGNEIFNYRYPADGCNTAWNAIPLHLEGLVFGTAPAPTPTPTPTASPPAPKISVEAAPTRIAEGTDTTYTISASTINPFQATTVHYSMSGKAQFGNDYTLSGIFGQASIPAGASSTTIVLHVLSDAAKEKTEKVTMTLSAGSNYKLSKAKKATVTIFNTP
jgi:hypothetical protein